MIEIQYSRFPDGTLESFIALGHANYAEPGKDIVCAGVTALFLAAVDVLEELLLCGFHSQSADGNLQLCLPWLGNYDQRTVSAIRGAGSVLIRGCHLIHNLYGPQYIKLIEQPYCE